MLPAKRSPTHPGEIIREMYLKPLKLTQDAFAGALDISRPRANELLNGRRSVTPDTAVRLGIAFNTSPQYWLNMQAAFDLYRAKQKHKYRNVHPLTKAA